SHIRKAAFQPSLSQLRYAKINRRNSNVNKKLHNFCLLHCLSEGSRERRKAKSKEEKSRRTVDRPTLTTPTTTPSPTTVSTMAMAVSDTILSFVGFHASLLREDCTPRPEARRRAALRCAGSIAISGDNARARQTS